MVFLKDIKTQFPWNKDAPEDYTHKEIYTHMVRMEDASKIWRIPVLPPMDGYAFTGMRVFVAGKNQNYTMCPRLFIGETNSPMFGLPWDNTLLNLGQWAPLGFPLTHKMIAICEDGLDYVIQHLDACYGKVEFIAQRFDDLEKNERDISYIFLNHRTNKVEWILDENNRKYKPVDLDGTYYTRKAKVIPSMIRLLDKNEPEWKDTALYWNKTNIVWPLDI